MSIIIAVFICLRFGIIEYMSKTVQIMNPSNEKLDVLISGNDNATTTVVFAHGLGVTKHETTGMFDAVAQGIGDVFRTVQFDFSGFGKSEGRQEDFDYYKHAKDLGAVLSYVRTTYPGKIYIVAHSMGTFVTTLLNPPDVEKAVLSGTPNSNTQFIIDRLIKRFTSKPGGKVDLNGISLVPRSTGEIQKFGPEFWKTLKEFNPVEAFNSFASHTKTLIIHPKQDDVVGLDYQDEYNSVANATVIWTDGDHSFKKEEDRKKYVQHIRTFFTQ